MKNVINSIDYFDTSPILESLNKVIENLEKGDDINYENIADIDEIAKAHLSFR